MLVRPDQFQRPTDGRYAFRLRVASGQAPGFSPSVPPVGAVSDIRDVAREVLAEGEAERYARALTRWGGPEDERDGGRPYAAEQFLFEEAGPRARLTAGDVDAVLRGRVRVLRAPGGQTDYVLRDHHTLDVVLYHHRTTGALPRGLFHADRHSDWCNDAFLGARVPPQAATWWALLEGLKRADGQRPVLRERDVVFTTAQAARRDGMAGRDIGASVRIPGSVDPDTLAWERALEVPHALDADWVSLDLDYFQPAPQLRLTRGLVRDARFAELMARARVRLFVLSPQFTRGGDKIDPWVVQGSLASSLRLLNLLRR